MKTRIERDVNAVKKNKYGYSTGNTKEADRRRLDISPPEVVSMDVLSYSLDEELERHHAFLLSERDKALNVSVDSRLWEVELAYAQRELKIRMARRAAHEKYVRSMSSSWGPELDRQTKTTDEESN